ncbi:MAG TPA: ACP S-malonyltransferase [Kofleriaceae bacterium]|nr:ACP S-malonyltransferase [Kofleriaceae bacterium]
MTIAFLFAGQGVDPPWVARDLLAEPAVAELVDLAGDAAGVDMERLLIRGGRELARPEVLQPALVAVSLGAFRLLARAGVRPDLAAGHSLGELSAWAACECVAAEDAVRAAALRGRLMAREAANRPGGMLALTGATHETCLEAVALGAGSVCIAAHNAPDEWVLSGDLAALSRIAARFRGVRLAVAGAWHSPAMAGAVGELGAALASIPRRPGRARWVANRDGQVADEPLIPELLAGQLVRPIRWVAALRTLEASGCRRLVAVGPGKMLRALVRRTLGAGIEVEMAETLRDVERAAS